VIGLVALVLAWRRDVTTLALLVIIVTSYLLHRRRR
jgi:hypothetical protein